MRSIPHVNLFPAFLSGLLSLVIIWSAWRPAEGGVWWMEVSWVLGVFVLLAKIQAGDKCGLFYAAVVYAPKR